jgi:hypothetical protein
MKSRPPTMLMLAALMIAAVLCAGIIGVAEPSGPPLIAGQNINMVSGTTLVNETGQRVALGGDPFLQRQNEPSIAVSTRNAMHLLAGANDYRTVDLPGLPDDKATGDSWLGLFKSFDGGQSWQSTLLPGFPQALTAQEGADSPIHGYAAAADPTVRAGTNGMFYYSGVAFNRGTNALSSLFVARFIDLNNREGAHFNVPKNQDPIKYLGTSVIETGTSGQFLDKPWLAVDIPRGTAATASLNIRDTDVDGNAITVAQSIPCGNVYLAYADFTGDLTKNAKGSKVLFTKSEDCGATWSKPIMIDESFHISQGTNIAIGPNGEIYIAWRQFKTSSDPDAIVMARSTDFGKKFTKAAIVAKIQPFDQDSRPENEEDPFREFRTNSYPTMVVDGLGTLYIAWSERGYWGTDSIEPADGVADGNRVVYVKSTDGGSTWSAASKVDDTDDPKASQVMPSFAFAGGRLLLVYYDFRDDLYPDLYNLLLENNHATASGLYPQDPSWPLADPIAFEPLPVRHTVEVRAAQVAPIPVADGGPTARVSRYMSAVVPTTGSDFVSVPLQSNPVNVPIFAGGTTPFLGDYIDIAAAPQFVPDPANGGKWIYNTGEKSPVFHAVWADNRNVMPPPPQSGPDGLRRVDWTNYSPPGSCNNSYPGMRNQDVYTSRLSQGLVLGSYGNFKPLNIERAFSIFVENTNQERAPAPGSTYSPATRIFRLTINAPANVNASFQPLSQSPVMTQKDVEVHNLGKVAVTVFASLKSGNANTSFQVRAQELNSDKSIKTGGLEGTLVLNPDATNPAPLNVDSRSNQLATSETHDPEFVPISCSDFTVLPAEVRSNCNGSTAVTPLTIQWPTLTDPANPALLNPALLNPALLNPALLNPALLNPALLNPALLNPALLNPALLNPALLNPALLNPALLNPALLNPALLNPALLNDAVLNPALLNPALLNPALLNPALLNPALLNSAPSAANLNQVAYNSSLIQGTVLDPLNPNSTPATLTDVIWKVKNIGNDASSYFFTWFSALEQKPEEIILYRTYRTPLAGANCSLTEDGLHYEFLANILRPDQLNPAELSSAVTFSLAPEDELYVVMRFLDPDGPAGPGGIDPALVAAQVLAQAANTNDKYATVTYVGYSPGAAVYGDKVTLTVKVLSAGGSPTGNVVAKDGGATLNTVALSGGLAAIELTNLDAGIHTVTVDYIGDGTFKPSTSTGLTLTIQKATPMFVNLSGPTITYGQSPTSLGGLVKAGSIVPPGSVSVQLAGATISAPIDSAGGFSASFDTAALGVKGSAYPISYYYPGSANYNGAGPDTSKVLTILPAASATTITSVSPEPSVTGQPVVVNFAVQPASSGNSVPAGSVTVSDGVSSCTGTLANGAGSCSLVWASAGARSLTAAYQPAPDSNFAASGSAAYSHQVNKADTTTTIVSDLPDPSRVGQAVTVSFRVTPSFSLSGLYPTGTVTVADGAASCSGTLTAGAGSCTLVLTTAGDRTLTASYAGDANFNASQTAVGESHSVQLYLAFSGFGAPLGPGSDPPSATVYGPFNITSNVTIKWQLQDYFGNYIGDLAMLSSLKAIGPAGTITLYDPNQNTTGSTELRYDSTSGKNQYLFNWDVTQTPPGSYTLVLELADGNKYKVNVLTQ